MPKSELTTEEAQLLAVYRAAKDVGAEAGASDLHTLLSQVVDLSKKESDLTAGELKQFISGFVQGAVATISASDEPEADWEYLPVHRDQLSDTVSGGPTGGVVEGQGKDPRYVTQTGVREDTEKEPSSKE